MIRLPAVFAGLFRPCRYKVFYGGRGGGKSWAFADALLTVAMQRRVRVLCARELQISISDSVHRLLRDRIAARGLDTLFTVTNTAVTAANGSEFLFKGLRHNASEIKSLEGVDICWVEEAQRVSQESWDVLIPTIRKEHSEIWVSFNPGGPNDPTWTAFVEHPRPGGVLRKVTWRDNPYFTSTLDAERRACLEQEPDKYAWIWEGEPRVISEAQIFKGRWRVEDFETPTAVRFFLGCDWGFGPDPSVLVKACLRRGKNGDEICVCAEAWAKGLDLEHLPELFGQVPESRRWPIVADSARPELIRYMRRQGYIVKPAKKWPGSIEDGIAVLRKYSLVLHPRCVETIKEMQRYSYKTDPLTGDVLPSIVDRDNHCVDSLRYAFDSLIRGKVGKA